MMKNYFVYATQWGYFYMTYQDDVLCSFTIRPEWEGDYGTSTPFAQQVCQQVTEYFQGSRTAFTIPIQMEGTPFQRSVWQALQTIPYGETRSYGQIATAIGNPKGSRAVGMANNKNHLLLFVPCHRVVGANGQLVGFGAGLPLKKQLLQLEGIVLTADGAIQRPLAPKPCIR